MLLLPVTTITALPMKGSFDFSTACLQVKNLITDLMVLLRNFSK